MNDQKKLFSLAIFVVVSVVLMGCGSEQESNLESTNQELDDTKEMVEQKVVEQKKIDKMTEEVVDEMDSIFDGAQAVTLKDVTGGNATGTGWIVVRDGKTHHRAVAENLPILQNGDFYEGWLVKAPVAGGFFSTGEMKLDTKTNQWVLNYETAGDKSDYKNIVITIEPDDGDPAPAKHILEEE